MSIWEILLLGVALSMDAVAVGMTNGMAEPKMRFGKVALVALFYGFFQGAMPLAGYYCGSLFSAAVEAVAPWLSFVLLAFIGGKMIWDCLKKDEGEPQVLGVKRLFLQALATSIDALAVGVTLLAAESAGGLPVPVWACALVIAGVALFFIGCALAITSSGAPRWIGILLAAVGVFAFWCRSNLDRIMAKRSRGSLDEGGSGNQRRLSVVADDGMAVEKNDEDARFFPFTKLTDVLEDDEILVAVFGDEGVLLPRDAFKLGSSDDFAAFIQQKRDARRDR